MGALKNRRHERFCLEYVRDLNATQAAIRVGYSQRAAKQIGSRLLTYADVADRVAELQMQVANKLEITAERVLRETARIAFADPRRFFNEDGTLKNIKDLDDDSAAALASFEIEDGNTQHGRIHKIKRYDKGSALTLLGKHLKLFKDQVELDVGEGLAEAIAAARRRAP